MLKEAIDRILELKRPETVVVAGRTYCTGVISEVKDPMPKAIQVETLTGIVDYLDTNRDSLEKAMLFLHVGDFRTVSVCQTLTDNFLQRRCYLLANHSDNGCQFGQFRNVENFIIELQSQFVQDDVTAQLLQVVGALQHEEGVKQTDDGVTQEVTAKKGITKVGMVEVPNPVTLRPYRTFLEIDQPSSTFVFRMKHDQGSGITCALFDADGGLWKLEAITRIRDWLSEKIQDVPVIA